MTRFFKLSGAGNDFIALAQPDREPRADEIRAWCRRRLSVGADGLFVLRRVPGRRPRRVDMQYFNSDGLEADLCLNATRCAARLATHLQWAKARLAIGTSVGVLQAEILDETRVAVEAPLPALEPERRVVDGAESAFEGWSVTIGVPHFVVLAQGPLAEIDVECCAPPIRGHAVFGNEGTNVNFVTFHEANRMSIRSYERGIEAETPACGTGILAAVSVGVETGQLTLPATVHTQGGFDFEVAGEMRSGAIVSWSLIGDARLVASGTIHSPC